MAHDGDASTVLNGADQTVASARDDEIDVLILLEEGGDFVAGLNGLDVVGGQVYLCQRGSDGLGEECGRSVRFLRAFQDSCVACRNLSDGSENTGNET